MNDEADAEFARLMKGVKPLKTDRINIYPQTRNNPPVARQMRERSIPMEPVAYSAIAADNSHFNPGLQKKIQRKIRQGDIRPEARLDLHGYRQQQALRELDSFFAEALSQGLRMAVVIHGQGYRSESEAVLKPLVFRWLADQSFILAWCPAQPRDGAAGASYVYLRG
ncbi:MAG: DNA-nicking Smr family endonuclease [Planctomycetota bacterium]|jgi:DNA-nicking Smr family endonuclease